MDLPIITKRIIMANMTLHRIRLSKMQKVINVLALASAAVSLAVVGGGAFVYVQRDAILDDIKEKAMEAVLGGVGGGLGGDLPVGAPDLSPQTNPAANSQAAVPEPTAPVQF